MARSNYKELIRRHRIRKACAYIFGAIALTATITLTVSAFSEEAEAVKVEAYPAFARLEQPLEAAEVRTIQKQTGDFPGKPEVIGEPDPAYSLSGEDRELLVRLAMAEAEGEPTKGKALVMLVVLNRVDDPKFPNTVSGVIYAEGQFSPVSNGRFDAVVPDDDCYAALRLVLDGWNESEEATYFRQTTTESTWHSRNLEELFACGHHTFYKEKD